MGEYMFGVVKGNVSIREFNRCDKIARTHGAYFTGAANIPGIGPQYWFCSPNRGQPFDSNTGRAVMAEVGKVIIKIRR